jgi:hypothetical protein
VREAHRCPPPPGVKGGVPMGREATPGLDEAPRPARREGELHDERRKNRGVLDAAAYRRTRGSGTQTKCNG